MKKIRFLAFSIFSISSLLLTSCSIFNNDKDKPDIEEPGEEIPNDEKPDEDNPNEEEPGDDEILRTNQIIQTEGGTITSSANSLKEGENVVFTFTPDEGYYINEDSVSILNNENKVYFKWNSNDNTATLKMLKGGFVVSASFNKIEINDISLDIGVPKEKEEALKILIDEFKEDRKNKGDFNNYTFNILNLETSKVKEEAGSWSYNGGPDVYFFDSKDLVSLSNIGVLTRLMGDYEDYVNENFYDSAKESTLFGDKIYAFPHSINYSSSYVLMYDKRVFNEEDVKNLDNILKRIEEENVRFSFPLYDPYYLSSTLFTFGASYSFDYDYNNNKISYYDSSFFSDKGLEIYKIIYNLVKNNYVYKNKYNTLNGNIKIAINKIEDYSKNKSLLGDNLGIAPLPFVKSDKYIQKRISSYSSYELIGINPLVNPFDKELIPYEFASFLSTPSSLNTFYKYSDIYPVNSNFDFNTFFKDDTIKNSLLREMNSIIPDRNLTNALTIDSKKILIDPILNGSINESNLSLALKNLDEAIIYS